MNFEQAVVKFMKVYWNDQKKYQKMTSSQNSKYTKDYFDGIENDLMPSSNGPKGITKDKKDNSDK